MFHKNCPQKVDIPTKEKGIVQPYSLSPEIVVWEKMMKNNINEEIKYYDNVGYDCKEVTFILGEIMFWGCILAFIAVVPLVFIFHYCWSDSEEVFHLLPVASEGVLSVPIMKFLIEFSLVVLILIVSAFPHEFLHALGFLPACQWKWKGNIKIGLMWKMKLPFPYCKCTKRIVSSGYYVLALLLPFVVMGAGMSIVAIIIGSTFILWIGCMHIIISCADLSMALLFIFYRPSHVLDSGDQECFIFLNKII
jgi:hypothetical protein